MQWGRRCGPEAAGRSSNVGPLERAAGRSNIEVEPLEDLLPPDSGPSEHIPSKIWAVEAWVCQQQTVDDATKCLFENRFPLGERHGGEAPLDIEQRPSSHVGRGRPEHDASGVVLAHELSRLITRQADSVVPLGSEGKQRVEQLRTMDGLLFEVSPVFDGLHR